MSLRTITVKAVYFVPNDQTPDRRMFNLMGRVLRDCQRFHYRQLRYSYLHYRLGYVPVMGQHPLAYYMGDFFNRVSAEALRAERYYRVGDAFPIVCIFVEGEKSNLPLSANQDGTAGLCKSDRGHCIISRRIVREAGSRDVVGSITYHELGHAFGLDHPPVDDYSVMSLGCWSGLSNTWLNERDREYILDCSGVGFR